MRQKNTNITVNSCVNHVCQERATIAPSVHARVQLRGGETKWANQYVVYHWVYRWMDGRSISPVYRNGGVRTYRGGQIIAGIKVIWLVNSDPAV